MRAVAIVRKAAQVGPSDADERLLALCGDYFDLHARWADMIRRINAGEGGPGDCTELDQESYDAADSLQSITAAMAALPARGIGGLLAKVAVLLADLANDPEEGWFAGHTSDLHRWIDESSYRAEARPYMIDTLECDLNQLAGNIGTVRFVPGLVRSVPKLHLVAGGAL